MFLHLSLLKQKLKTLWIHWAFQRVLSLYYNSRERSFNTLTSSQVPPKIVREFSWNYAMSTARYTFSKTKQVKHSRATRGYRRYCHSISRTNLLSNLRQHWSVWKINWRPLRVGERLARQLYGRFRKKRSKKFSMSLSDKRSFSTWRNRTIICAILSASLLKYRYWTYIETYLRLSKMTL